MPQVPPLHVVLLTVDCAPNSADSMYDPPPPSPSKGSQFNRFFQPRLRPGLDRQRRRTRRIERRRLEVAREHQPFIHGKIAVILVVIAFEPVLHVHRLLGADEAELQVLQRDAVVGVPAAQHRAADLHRNAADGGALPDPARRRIADPRLAVALVHVFDEARRRSSWRDSDTARRRRLAAACSSPSLSRPARNRSSCCRRNTRNTNSSAAGSALRVTTVRISPVKNA